MISSLSGLTRVLYWWRDERRDEPERFPSPRKDAEVASGSSLVRPVAAAGRGSSARATAGRVADPARDPRRAYRVVDDFESELAHYTGAPHAVAVDSCTNALLLALTRERSRVRPAQIMDTIPQRPAEPIFYDTVKMPRRTYVGVLQSALNAGWLISWSDEEWQQDYFLHPTCVLDSARRIAPGMYLPGTFTCLSFHAAKQLPLGRGGAILTDDGDAADWLRAARMDGRPPGEPISETVFPGFHCPMPPDVAARGLWILSRWVDSGYSPPPLQDEEYPDLSELGS